MKCSDKGQNDTIYVSILKLGISLIIFSSRNFLDQVPELLIILLKMVPLVGYLIH